VERLTKFYGDGSSKEAVLTKAWGSFSETNLFKITIAGKWWWFKTQKEAHIWVNTKH
jgi:hypothetical protein